MNANAQPAFPLLVQTLCDLAPVGKDIEILFCWKKRRKVSLQCLRARSCARARHACDCLGAVERDDGGVASLEQLQGRCHAGVVGSGAWLAQHMRRAEGRRNALGDGGPFPTLRPYG